MSDPIISCIRWRTDFQALKGLKMHRKIRKLKRLVIKTTAKVEREFEPSTRIMGATSFMSMSEPSSGEANSV